MCGSAGGGGGLVENALRGDSLCGEGAKTLEVGCRQLGLAVRPFALGSGPRELGFCRFDPRNGLSPAARVEHHRLGGYKGGEHGLAGNDRIAGFVVDAKHATGQRRGDHEQVSDAGLAFVVHRDLEGTGRDLTEIHRQGAGCDRHSEQYQTEHAEHAPDDPPSLGCWCHNYSRVLRASTRSRRSSFRRTIRAETAVAMTITTAAKA